MTQIGGFAINFENEFKRRIFTQTTYFTDPLENLRIAVVLKKLPQTGTVPPQTQELQAFHYGYSGVATSDGTFWTSLIGWQQKLFSPEYVFLSITFLNTSLV